MTHQCHWPGCRTEVPPKLWGCKRHWLMLPKPLRNRIWATYRRGQEDSEDPSKEYVDAAAAAQDWIKTHAFEMGYRYPLV